MLERSALHHAAHAEELPDSLDALLAALACARAEVLWWFRHWGEVRWPFIVPLAKELHIVALLLSFCQD